MARGVLLALALAGVPATLAVAGPAASPGANPAATLKLPDLHQLFVEDLAGKRVSLAAIGQGRPAVLVFLRHFGCLFCREQAVQLGAIQPQLTALGVGLAFVGSGAAIAARDFQASFHVTAPLYVAPDLEPYRALGFRNDLASTFSPKALAHAARAWQGGFRQGATEGAALQQGGVVLVRADGQPAWVYRSGEAGDHPPPALILELAKAL